MINAAKRLDRNGFLEHILTYNMKMYVIKVTNVITQVHINIPFHINVINVVKRLGYEDVCVNCDYTGTHN